MAPAGVAASTGSGNFHDRPGVSTTRTGLPNRVTSIASPAPTGVAVVASRHAPSTSEAR